MPNKFIIAYDFDDTLSATNLAAHVMKRLNTPMDIFLTRMKRLALEQQCDPLLAYLGEMLRQAHTLNIPITKEFLHHCGREAQPFNGLTDSASGWFSAIAHAAHALNWHVQHYVVSCNLKELIGGTSIAPFFTDIFGSSFAYDAQEHAFWPATAVTASEKCACMHAICSGLRSEQTSDEARRLACLQHPLSRVLFIGDGATDIPVMRFVTAAGGHALVVYDPDQPDRQEAAQAIAHEGHAAAAFPADYSLGAALYNHVCDLLRRHQPHQ